MNYRIILFTAIVLISACQKHDNQSNTKVMGHAATGLSMLSSFYHDNSLEAINNALETEGCDGIEIDVQISASGTLWLFHDAALNVETTVSGCINSKTDEELDQIHYKTIRKEKLVRFSDIPFHKLSGKTLMLDLRHYNQCEQTIISSELMMEQLLKYLEIQDGIIELYLLINYQPWLDDFENSPFQLIYSTETYEEAREVILMSSFDGVMLKNSAIKKEEVKELKDIGKKIIIFEVRSPKSIRKAFKKNPNYLVTDDLQATIIEK